MEQDQARQAEKRAKEGSAGAKARALFDALFLAPASAQASVPAHKLLQKIFLLALLLLGAAHWLYFFDTGGQPIRVQDWEWQHRFLAVIQQGLRQGAVPFHMSDFFNGSNRFLAFLNIPTSPQLALLTFLSIDAYIVANTLLLYLAGFHGLLLLRRRHGLSLFSFAVMFLLFNFNGYLTAHLGIGHVEWLACFFLPYFLLGAARVLEDAASSAVPPILLAALALMALQGGIHIFLISQLFLLLAILCNSTRARWAMFAKLNAVLGLLLAFRFLPALLAFGDVRRPFFPGYKTAGDLLNALTAIHGQHFNTFNFGNPPVSVVWWEYDAYITLAGFLFIAVFGVGLSFARGHRLDPLRPWWGATALMTFLAFSHHYYFVLMLRIPFLSTVERVPSRFIIVPLLVLLVMACRRLQALLDGGAFSRGHKLAALALLAHTGFMLYLHSANWRLANLTWVQPEHFAGPEARLIQVDDPDYKRVVAGACVLSLLAGVLLALRWWKGREAAQGDEALG